MSNLKHFVQLMSYVHNDNGNLHHYARSGRDNSERSTMPITSFIYEFFMYNALYSIDWSISTVSMDIMYNMQGRENRKQNDFEDYIKLLCSDNGIIFFKSFSPLLDKSFTGPWTDVVPDSRITKEIGKKYFNNMDKLHKHIKNGIADNSYEIEAIFRLIRECRYYVYLVRCNVFHGSKNVGDIDEGHKKRIQIYYLFLKCVLDGFFNLTKNGNIFERNNRLTTG